MDDRGKWFEAVVVRWQQPLVAYTWRLGLDLDAARDVVQDALLKLWQVGPEKVGDHVTAWLFTVCRNRAIDRLRKERKMKPLQSERVGAEPGANPAVSLEERQQHQGVLEAIERLPEKQKEVIRLKFQDGLSYREISRVTGLSESNVGFLIHGGVCALRAVCSRLAGEEV